MTRRLSLDPAWACKRAGLLLRALLIILVCETATFSRQAPTFAARSLGRLSYDGHTTPLAWAADGQTLLVRRPGARQPGQQLSELWAIDLQGKERLLSDNAFYPALHDRSVAYLQYVATEQWLAVMHDLDETTPVSLGPASWRMPPAWVEKGVVYLDPAGRPVAAAGQDFRGQADVWTAPGAQGRLSPDGQHAAATDGRRLWVVDHEGQILPVGERPAQAIVWSPNGESLAFILSGDGPTSELWVWNATDGAQLLTRDEMAHLDAPVWSPDGRTLAWSRHATGSGPNTAGDIWLIETDGSHLRSLAQTAADERAPVWSPDGTRLALAIEGDVWIVDLEAPALEWAEQGAGLKLKETQLAPLSLTLPPTIRVIHDDAGNLCRDVPDGQIDEYSFEAYVQRVVPNEVPASWPGETLKAQAVAARTYAWRKTLSMRQEHPELGYDVWDSTRDQYMCDPTPAKPLPPSTNAAVEATARQYIDYGDLPAYAFYCAEAGSPTNYKQEFNLSAAPYLRPVNDPVSFGQTRRGHSWGMSQWGAYRWASWHGWNYIQILNHYYSLATVSGSGEPAPPVAGLVLPWSDFYIRTANTYLQANAAGASRALTVTFATDVTGTWTTVYTDTDATDDWGYVWPVAGLAETITPSIGLRTAVYDNAGQVATSTTSYVGLDRTPPAGTLGIAQTAVHTTHVTLELQATDPPPTSGTVRCSLGNADWTYEDGQAGVSGGEIVNDPLAGDGSAWRLSAFASGIMQITPDAPLVAGARYRALFRIRAPAEAFTDSLEALILDATAADGTTLLGRSYVRGIDLYGTAYQEVSLDWVASGGARLELRTALNAFDVWVDRVRLVSYPVEVVPQIDWTLPAREGPVTVTAQYLDRADNPSADVALVVTVVDDSPPDGWRAFQCAGSTCSVEVQDAIAGLDVDRATYRTSGDGGQSWSEWQAAVCTGSRGSHDWETITAPIGGGSTSPALLIQFAIDDAAAAANRGVSPAYATWRIYLPSILHDAG